MSGYSYGGGIAMMYGIKHPEIKRVIPIAGVDWGQYFEDYIRDPELKKIVDAGLESAIAAGVIRFEAGSMPREIALAGLDKLDPEI